MNNLDIAIYIMAASSIVDTILTIYERFI
jgi:hypothetical protein